MDHVHLAQSAPAAVVSHGTLVTGTVSETRIRSPHSPIDSSKKRDNTSDSYLRNGTAHSNDDRPTSANSTTICATHEEKSLPNSDEESEEYPTVCDISNMILPPFIDYSHLDPMRSDFYLYAEERKNELTTRAKTMVQSRVEKEDMNGTLIWTALNELLIKKWENETEQVRMMYLQLEQQDWARFMQEDAVLRRHCDTHTSRMLSVPPTESDTPNPSSSADGTDISEEANIHESHKRRKIDESVSI
jgi:hypothetical protein